MTEAPAREDGLRLHDHDVHDRPLHALDAALARYRRLRHSGRTSVWELLFRLEPAGIPVLVLLVSLSILWEGAGAALVLTRCRSRTR